MLSLAFALALLAQDTPPAASAETPAAAEDRLPAGAPRDDYPFVAWCYGALRGYLDLHDQVMPEVTRIEAQFRRPGSRLEDDLKVYANMRKDGREKLKLFQNALTAAEKASVRPLNTVGAAAVQQGRAVWKAGPEVSPPRLAQEWMSWTLPLRCEKTAAALETRAKLLGTALQVNATDAPAPSEGPTPVPNED